MNPILHRFNRGILPSERLLRRDPRRVYGILHFGLNTFSDREWGFGDESPELFHPTDFDASQIARACRDGGLSGLILVCKHHDGFCLWPTKTTDYSIARSPFRNGNGDLIRELSDACREEGLEVGFYVSPWDRNSAAYGTPDYLPIFRAQLHEICTGYGEAFEFWFDGANGGDGYYGGARETRTIDRSSYYDWENTWSIVRALQPNAAIFSDVGPDLRWVGNETGFADPDARGTYTPHCPQNDQEAMPGFVCAKEGTAGHPDGRFYLPPECDVPMRPGWFYHASEDGKTRSLHDLVRIYFTSVGAGAFLNLGIAPDTRGQLPREDTTRLQEFGHVIRALFSECVLDETLLLYGNHAMLEFCESRRFNLAELSEEIEQGEAVTDYLLRVRSHGIWSELFSGNSIGAKRLRHFQPLDADAIEFSLRNTLRPVQKIFLKLYRTGQELLPSDPTRRGAEFDERPVGTRLPAPEFDGMAVRWTFDAPRRLRVLTAVPLPDVEPMELADHYVLELSEDGITFRETTRGEFANIRANPIPQTIHANPSSISEVRALRLTLSGAHSNSPSARFRFFAD